MTLNKHRNNRNRISKDVENKILEIGYLTPMEFYKLWKENSNEAYAITKKYQTYLLKQKIRLANARKIKRKEQIENLMKFIDAKLKDNKTQIQRSKLQLINCQLCSLA